MTFETAILFVREIHLGMKMDCVIEVEQECRVLISDRYKAGMYREMATIATGFNLTVNHKTNRVQGVNLGHWIIS